MALRARPPRLPRRGDDPDRLRLTLTPPRTVLAGLLVFVGLVALQHPLRGDRPPDEHFISDYAHGSTAALQVSAFAAWTIALAAGAWLAWRACPPAASGPRHPSQA